MDVNDRYILEITSSVKGLNKVAGDLDTLKKSLSGFSFPKSTAGALTNFSNSIYTLGKATSAVDTGKIIAFSSALQQLSNVKIRLPKGMDETVKSIEKAFTGLGDSKELYKKINAFSRIMQPLSDIKFTGIKGASGAIKTFGKTLDAIDYRKLHGQIDAIARTIEPLNKVDAGKLSALASALRQIGNSKIQNINGVDKSIEGIQKALAGLDAKKFFKTADGFKRILQPLSDLKFGGLKGASSAVEEFSKALDKIDFRKIHGQADALNRILSPLASTMSSLTSASASLGIDKSFGRGVGNAINGISQTLDTGTTKIKKKGSTKGATEDSKEQVNITERVRDAFTKAIAEAKRFGSECSAVAQKVVSAFKKVLRVASSLAGAFVKAGKAVMSIGFLNPFKGVADSVQNVIKKLRTLGSSLARIALYRALRSAIKEVSKAVREGLNNLYQWSKATGGDFAPAVDKLATAFLYLKNSIGASVSPLITYFAPAIDLAVDKIVELINVVNQLFARLTGRATWTRALKYPTEFAEKAGGATKKVKDNIQDFDELHILRTPSGGSGKKVEDYSKMFEETEFSQGLTDWIENLKDAIKAGRWYEAGNIIADEINKVINNINWGKLGTSLGNKINDMFSFAWGFLHNIDFVKIGSSVATFLNNAINTIDTYQIGQVLARKWTMIFDTLYGFVSTFDFPAFGWKVSELVEGWFDELDGARIGTTISDIIKGALDSAIAFLSNDAMLDKFVEDIAGIINNIDWYGIFCRVLTIATQIANALSDIIDGVMNGTGRQSSSGFDVERVTASAPASIAQRVISEQNYAVSRGWAGSFGDQLTQNISDSVNSANTRSLAEALKNLFIKAWKAIKATLGELFKIGCTEIVTEAINEIGASGGLTGNILRLIGGDQHSTLEENLPTALQSPAHSISSAQRAYGEDRENNARRSSRNAGNAIFAVAGALAGTSGGAIGLARDLGLIKSSANATQKSITNLSKTTSSYATTSTRAIATHKSSFVDFKTTVVDGSKEMERSYEDFGNKLNGDFVNKMISSKNTISATITSLTEDTKFKMNDMSNTIISSIDNTDKAVTTPLANIKNQITTAFKDAGTESVGAIKDMGNNMKGALDGVINSSRDSVKGYKDIWDGLHSTVKNTSNSVIAGAESMGNGVTTAFNQIIRNLKNFKVTIPNIGDNKDAGKQFNFEHLQEIQKISIPRLATGGIITSPMTALIGEAGKEAVVPLENNTGWMDALAERIGADGEEIAILREQNDLLRQIASKNVTISSRDVFNAVRDENADYITMTGKNALVM